MMSFFHVGVDDFELWKEHGTAAGVKTWSESRVSGGGGHNNTPVNISTHVTTRNEFFLVDGGKESAISLTGAVPLRDGQLASVIYVRRKSKRSGYAVLFRNHASKDERVFNGVINKDQQVTLPNTVPRTQNRSDLLAGLSGRLAQDWYTDFAINYDMNV